MVEGSEGSESLVFDVARMELRERREVALLRSMPVAVAPDGRVCSFAWEVKNGGMLLRGGDGPEHEEFGLRLTVIDAFRKASIHGRSPSR